jgi:hypothetical protein
MPRYRRYRFVKPLRDRPKAVCPSCGHGAPHYGPDASPAAARDRYLRRGRVRVRPDRWTRYQSRRARTDRSNGAVRPTVPYRIRPARTVVVPGFRSHWKCTDPFHGGHDTYWPAPQPQSLRAQTLPERVHHPDLAKAKAALSRALQGKDRR